MKQDTMKKVLLGLSSVVLATSTGVAVWVLLRSRWYNEKKTYEKISKLASDLNELLINHPDREKIRDLLKLEQSKENRIKLEDEIKKMLVKEADERKNILDHINQINDPKKRQALLDELKEAKTWDVRSEILEKAKKQIAKEWEKKIKDKSDFAKSIIDQIKDDAVKQNLLDRLSKETEHDDETLTDIDTIAKEAQQQVAKETNDAIEAIKAKMMELAYPGGVNANGTQDVINKLNAIQNSDNDDKTKMALAEKIANTFDDHNNKIKEVKAEIEKLEPSKQQVLLDKLDNAKFLHDDLNKTKEFDSLLNEVKALQDAELAEFTKGINALENLSPEEKQEFINSLPKGSSDAEIKNKLKEAYKKDLENFIKKMDYPAKPDSAAQDALIQALTDNPEKYADNEKYLEELNRLKELSKLVDNANDSLNTIEGDKTALIEEFNNADTKEELEALLQHIADEKHKEVLAAKRAKISSIIDSLPYPEGSDAAKNELKAAYANENLTFTQLEQKEQEIREKIEPKVSEAKKKISKLSSDDQTRLNEEFKNAGSEEKLDALLAKINEAFNNSKEAQKSVIDDLTHLTHEQKEALKNQIDQATDFADIRKIVDRAQLLDKIEEAKSIITPESYALDENPEVKAIIDETIKSLKNQIEGLDAEDEVVAKKAELDELNKKLKDYKKQIEALTENEVNNPAETKVDLAKDLAKISNKDQFPNLDLEIAKAKLKKVASDLDYPGKPNNAAIKELQAQIEAVTTQDKLTELDNRIKNELPAKIAEAKAKIAAVRDSETTTRKQDLNRQLDEADTDEEFDALFKNIEKYKAQGDVEYSGKLKERLKEQAARLPYPGPDVPAKTALERKIEAETDIAELEKLQNETIPSMLNKINELKEEIAKRSPENIAKLNEKLNNASTPEELAAIDAEITKAINDEKAAIAAKIDALAHLTPEQKDAAKAKLDNKTYSEMDDVLERAKRDNLLALVNKLGYNDSETLPAPARTSLRSEVETAAESELDNKLTELEALKTAIENEKAEIDQINYSSDDAEGKNDLKERLNNLTTAASVNSLVDPSEVNNKLSTYKDIINDVNNPLSTIQKSDLTSELDKLPKNGAEKALRKEIFDAKKNAAIVAINALPSLTEERKRQLINDLPSWTDSLGSGNVDEFKNKIDEINSKIVDSRKEDLKAKIDALPFTGDAATTKQSLKNAVDSITNEATYNAQKDLLDRYKDELVRTKNKINQVQDQAEKKSLLAQADNITNADNFSTLDTPIAKALDKDYIDTLSKLTEEEKRGFKDRISAQDDQAERNKIKEEARALNELKTEKERLKAIVDSIEYPDTNAAATAIAELKKQIDALTANQISNKEQELNNLKNKVSAKVQIIDSLGDDLNSADTRNALKAEINKATTTQDLDNLVPDDLKSKLEGYKTLIEGSDLSEAIKTELKGLLAKTTNNGTVESKDFANLDQEIFNKFKDKVNEYITNAPHLPDKDAEKQTINSLTLNGDLSAGLRDLKNRLNDLHKKNYSAQIENLPFPKTDPADKDPAVARIKAAYVDNLNYGDNYAATEEKLNKLQPLMTDIKTKINGINNQDVKDVLNNLLMNASTVEKLEELNDKMDKYKSIADKINSINDRNILTTDSSFRETSTAIEELKTSLYNELSSTNNLDAFDTKVDEVIKTVDNAKRTFSNSSQQEYEILMIKTIVDEVKTSNTDQITNLNQRIPRIREKMRRFWHGDRGDAIRRQKDDLFNVGSKTFNYDALVRKMRSTTNLDALEDLVTDEVDLYLDVIAHRIKEKATTGLPQDVQNSIREKLVAAPTKTERANISKYVGARAFENGNVARGFFDDARQQLAAIPESNRSAWQTRFNDLATSDNDSDVLRKIDDFNREARTFGNKLTPSRTKLNEYRRNYPNATETIQKLETLLNNASSISDLDNFDALLAKVNSISSSINGLPYPNPSSANANTSKTTLLNSILPNVNGQSNEQQLTTLKAVTATSLDPKVTEINSLSQSIQAEKDEINGLSAYSTNAQALTNFKNELDKATTIAQTNVVPADWNTNVNKYKNLISTKFANHNTNGEINNLNARLNQMIPNDLDANKLADNTNVTYGENNMKKEIADEYSGYINKKFNDSNLSNLTQDQRTQFTNDINSLKSDDKINSTTSFENFKTEVIDKMDEKLNDAMVTNFKNLVNSIPELSQTSKNNIIKNIVKPNEKNTIESRKQNVQTQLNNLSDKVSEIITEIEDISDFNKKQAFYFDLADVDTQAKADALYNKIRQYKTLDKTNAQRAIDAIDTAHRGNLQSRLDAATEQSVVNAIEQEALLTAAKVDAKKLVEAMTYPNWSTSVNNTAAPKSGVAKLNESIDQATSVDQVNNLKTTIKAVRAALDSTKSEINLLTYDYDKNELNNELFAASTVAEMNTTKGKVLKKVKTEVNNRVEQQLRRAAQLMRPSDDTSKTMTRSEELYLEEFKRQVNSKTLVSDVRTKELDFLYGRFVDATRMRAIVLSIHNYFSGSYRFGGDKERADWDKKSPLLRNYVSNYNYKRGFNDSADSRTLFNFVKEYSYEAIPTAALRNTKYDWDVRKSWNLSAQFGISVQYEHGSDDNSIRSKISSSIITKAIEKVRANADWSIDKKYDLIYKLTSIVSDNSGNVYNKLVNLKTSDPDLGPLLQGNGNYGFDRSGHVYQDSLSEGNYRS